ncbi:hypothetical protein KKA00_02880, partial [bacterium]|nr:hypothetical protein [bacterium]
MTRTTMIFVLCAALLLSVTSVMASVEKDKELQALASVTDAAPYIGPVAPSYPMDAQWDLLATYDMAVTTSVLCLGVEFADGHWYVTDAGVSSGVATDNYINILNP